MTTTETIEQTDAAPHEKEDLLGAGMEYWHARRQVFHDGVELFKCEVRVGLLSVVAAAIGAVIALVFIMTSWILAMVGIAQMTSQWLANPGLNLLLLALLNVLGAAGLLMFARRMLNRAARVRPLSGLTAIAGANGQ